MSAIQISQIIKYAQLKLIAGAEGLHREVTTSDVSRPGLQFAGHFEHYHEERIQFIGRQEMTFFNQLTQQEREERFKKICASSTPGIIVTHDPVIPREMIDIANEQHVSLMQSTQSTTRLMSTLTNYLEAELAPTTSEHGVLLDIYGVGVLIRGKSGIGKSEVALELVKRGHRLVADDRVDIRRTDNERLIGSSPTLIQHLLEIRGVGIVNVKTLFGAGSVLEEKRIAFMVHIEEWDGQKEYDRLGIDEYTTEIMDVPIPTGTIPVRPGQNLAVIIEVAAMNFRQKSLGINAAAEFADRLSTMIEQEKNNPMEGR